MDSEAHSFLNMDFNQTVYLSNIHLSILWWAEYIDFDTELETQLDGDLTQKLHTTELRMFQVLLLRLFMSLLMILKSQSLWSNHQTTMELSLITMNFGEMMVLEHLLIRRLLNMMGSQDLTLLTLQFIQHSLLVNSTVSNTELIMRKDSLISVPYFQSD